MFLVDTLFAGQDLTRSLKIQLAQIYGKGRDKLEIIAPFAKSQVGGNDCMVFAIANLVEFCMGNFRQDKDSLSSRGDLYHDTLRSHCFRSSWPGLLMEGNPTRVIQLILIAAVGCRMSTTAMDVGGGFIMCVLKWVSLLCLMWLCCECEQEGDDVIGRTPRYVCMRHVKVCHYFVACVYVCVSMASKVDC